MSIHSPVDEAQHASAINLLLAIWLFIFPFVTVRYGFSGSEWNSVFIGSIVGALAAIRLAVPRKIPGASWINAACGVWLILSPWALRFSDERATTVNALVVGCAIVVLAVRSARATRRLHHHPSRA